MIYTGDFYLEDLQYLAEHSSNKHIEAFMQVFLGQIEESKDAIWCLSEWKEENKNPFFNVRAINHLQQQGYNLYRLRPLGSSNLNRYRVIYAYDNEYDDFYLLAVVEKPPKEETGKTVHDRIYNYEEDHAIIKRVCEEYDDRGIPRIMCH